MFLWTAPKGIKTFGLESKEYAEKTKVLAANQGLYNGFLAAGLIWALFFIKDTAWQKNIALFFLGCIAIAGVYGAATASSKIIFVQTVPAVLAMLAALLLKAK